MSEKLRALVADSDAEVADHLAALLEESGFEVRRAADAGALDRALDEESYAIFFVDFTDIEGATLRAIQRVRAKDSEVPIVVCAGRAPDDLPDDIEVLHKPCERVALVAGAVRLPQRGARRERPRWRASPADQYGTISARALTLRPPVGDEIEKRPQARRDRVESHDEIEVVTHLRERRPRHLHAVASPMSRIVGAYRSPPRRISSSRSRSSGDSVTARSPSRLATISS
jgi:DNA-binding response OmpR family regulator